MVIAEGLGGRTTVSDDPIEGAEKNGKTYLYPCLMSHKPLDVVVIMLGTNDLKTRFNKTPWEIAAGVGVLVDIVRTAAVGRGAGVPEILVVSPPPTSDSFPSYAEMFIGAPPKSHRLAAEYGRMAAERGVHFFDAGSVIKSSPVDGIHFDPEAHAALGKAVAAEIGKLAIPAP
jgi:lysophospholipase L1-like esterase